jgi:thioredoxin 2
MAAEMEKLHLACANCGQRARVARERLAEGPRCPRCHLPLLSGSPAALDEASFDRFVGFNDLPVLIDFWAPWCGPCKSFAPVIAGVASALKVTLLVGKVDTEAVPSLGARYDIRSIPTIVLYRGGKEVARQSGAVPATALLNWLAQQGVTAAV